MKRLLLIIDMQIGFINENTEHLPSRIVEYITKNREKFDDIVATKYINHENTACYIFEGWKACMNNTVETYLVPQIASKVIKVFEKDVYSCFNAQFRAYLRINKIDEVYICGVNTGCCVLHSAFDMYNELVSCYVLSDLCGSTSGKESHEAALKVLRECITSDRVIESGVDSD